MPLSLGSARVTSEQPFSSHAAALLLCCHRSPMLVGSPIFELLLLVMSVMVMETHSLVLVPMSKSVVAQMSLEVSLSAPPPEYEYSNHQVPGC